MPAIGKKYRQLYLTLHVERANNNITLSSELCKSSVRALILTFYYRIFYRILVGIFSLLERLKLERNESSSSGKTIQLYEKANEARF